MTEPRKIVTKYDPPSIPYGIAIGVLCTTITISAHLSVTALLSKM